MNYYDRIGVAQGDVLGTTLDEMDLSIRTYNCLKRYGLFTLKQILDMGEAKLRTVRNLGEKSIQELKDKVKEYGHQLT